MLIWLVLGCPGGSTFSCKSLHLLKDSYLHFMLIYFLCSYNALKFHIQEGDVNQQLSAPTHLLCASACG